MGIWKKLVLSICVLLGFYNNSFAQENSISRKGSFYFFWGYNRALYSNSDIHFSGNDYNFTLYNVEAIDKPEPLSWKYYTLRTLTIPQYNLDFGYFITDNISVQFNDDHMKYVMKNDIFSTIKGRVSNSISSKYKGQYKNDPIFLSDDFLLFEHTDGLNYINVDVNYNKPFLIKERITIDYILGAGAGALYPKTNTTLFNNERYDEFHLSGYGVHLKPAARITFFKYLTFNLDSKFGFINMPDIRTTMNKSDRASQHFWFAEFYFGIGGVFPIL